MFGDPEVCEAVILERYRRPPNEGRCEGETFFAETTNPLSGVELSISLRVEDGVIQCGCFDGGGCAVSTASASLMVERLVGEPVESIKKVVADYIGMMDGEGGDYEGLGRLQALQIVRGMPDRKRSALLVAQLLGSL